MFSKKEMTGARVHNHNNIYDDIDCNSVKICGAFSIESLVSAKAVKSSTFSATAFEYSLISLLMESVCIYYRNFTEFTECMFVFFCKLFVVIIFFKLKTNHLTADKGFNFYAFFLANPCIGQNCKK